MSNATHARPGPVNDPLDFVAIDVTGARHVEFDSVDGHRSAGEVAMSVAAAMDLPTNLPWSLRDQRHARMLQQVESLGSQIESGTELVVIPRSHLG